MINNSVLDKVLRRFYYPDNKKDVLPARLMVEPTSACNLKCSMCYVQQHLEQKHYLSLEDFNHIVSQFPDIGELIFCGIGEPFLNKDIFGMISIAKSKGIGFINLVTNGKLLNEETIKKIIGSGINRIQISVHSFDPDKFSKIRNEDAGSLRELKEGIKRLVALKNDTRNPLKICCNAVVNKFNYDDMLDFVKEAKSLGVDWVEFIQMTTAGDNLKGINAPLGPMAGIGRKVRRLAKDLGLEVSFLSGNDCGRCYQLWDFMMIHANGNISPCNGIFPTENIGVGNIFSDPVRQIWNSHKYQELRQLVRNGRLEYCNYCEVGYCLQGKDLRWFRNYYLRPLKRLLKAAIYAK